MLSFCDVCFHIPSNITRQKIITFRRCLGEKINYADLLPIFLPVTGILCERIQHLISKMRKKKKKKADKKDKGESNEEEEDEEEGEDEEKEEKVKKNKMSKKTMKKKIMMMVKRSTG